MGLGKTVQTLARIVQGQHTPAEKKVYKGGTLWVAVFTNSPNTRLCVGYGLGCLNG